MTSRHGIFPDEQGWQKLAFAADDAGAGAMLAALAKHCGSGQQQSVPQAQAPQAQQPQQQQQQQQPQQRRQQQQRSRRW
jgi:hypothetical protein